MSASALRAIADHLAAVRRSKLVAASRSTSRIQRPHLPQRAATDSRVPWWGIGGTQRRRPHSEPKGEALLGAYVGWVYKAVNAIANRVAEIPFQLVDVRPLPDGTEDRVPIPQHPYYDILGAGGQRKPNPMTSTYNLRKLTQIDLELIGNAYWYKVRDALGVPREVWRLRPDRMKPVVDKSTGMLLGWSWDAIIEGEGKVNVPFAREDVVHFMYPHPLSDPYSGVGPLRAAQMAFDIDESNRRFQQLFFEQGAQFSVVLSTDQRLEDEEVDAVLDDFEVKHQGLDNAWLPVVLSGGLKATPISAMNKDIEALGLMEFTRDDILSAFGVPKTKVGLGEAINQANAQALDVTFNRETINPRLRNLEESIEGQLLSDYPQLPEPRRLEIDHDNPVPEDREFELRESIELHAAGGITFNELRQRHGVPTFDTQSGFGDKVALGLGTELVDPNAPEQEEEEEPPAPPPPQDGDEEEAPEPEEESIEDVLAELLEAAGYEAGATRATEGAEGFVPQPWHSAEGAERLAVFRAARIEGWEAIMYRAMRRVFQQHARRALAAVEDAWRVDSSGGAPQSAADVEKHIKPHLLGARAQRETFEAFERVVMRIFRVEAPAALQLADEAAPRSMRQKNRPPFSWQQAALSQLEKRRNKLKGVNDTRWRSIRRIIGQTMIDPKFDGGVRTMQRRLAREFANDAVRALRVARTEAGSAANAAALAGFGAGGAPYKGWLATEDERTRESHARVHLQIVPVREKFANGLRHPGDPDGRAEEVINCRCSLTPEFEP